MRTLTAIVGDSILSRVGEREELLWVVSGEVRLHPRLTEADLRKLIFQAVFGADHLLADRARFTKDLAEEWSRLVHEPGRALLGPAVQVIDPESRTARLHLVPCAQAGIGLGSVASFLTSQPLKEGREERFRRLWSLVRDVVQKGDLVLPFPLLPAGQEALAPGHHSREYGATSYRVINDLTEPRTAAWVRETLSLP